jgi:hypothetical protein
MKKNHEKRMEKSGTVHSCDIISVHVGWEKDEEKKLRDEKDPFDHESGLDKIF